MVLSARLARMNRRGLNRLTGRIAHRLPGFGILQHVGRRSGRALTTPLNVFRKPGGGFVIALTYGPNTDWLKNVQAAKAAAPITTRGVSHRLVNPRVVTDPHLTGMPAFVRFVLRRIGVEQFLHLDPAEPTTTRPSRRLTLDRQLWANRSKNSSASTTVIESGSELDQFDHVGRCPRPGVDRAGDEQWPVAAGSLDVAQQRSLVVGRPCRPG